MLNKSGHEFQKLEKQLFSNTLTQYIFKRTSLLNQLLKRGFLKKILTQDHVFKKQDKNTFIHVEKQY